MASRPPPLRNRLQKLPDAILRKINEDAATKWNIDITSNLDVDFNQLIVDINDRMEKVDNLTSYRYSVYVCLWVPRERKRWNVVERNTENDDPLDQAVGNNIRYPERNPDPMRYIKDIRFVQPMEYEHISMDNTFTYLGMDLYKVRFDYNIPLPDRRLLGGRYNYDPRSIYGLVDILIYIKTDTARKMALFCQRFLPSPEENQYNFRDELNGPRWKLNDNDSYDPNFWLDVFDDEFLDDERVRKWYDDEENTVTGIIRIKNNIAVKIGDALVLNEQPNLKF